LLKFFSTSPAVFSAERQRREEPVKGRTENGEKPFSVFLWPLAVMGEVMSVGRWLKGFEALGL
jgi:hypothetical protein